MTTLLDDRTKFKPFQPDGRVKQNAFIYAQERFNRKVKEMHDNKKLSKEIYDKIRAVGSQPARLYGLPKVHKNAADPKYRPVLSMVNKYSTKLAKYLDSILKPYLPSELTVTDTFEFINQIKSFNLQPHHHLVSFDVVSLFTNIPVEETINHICNTFIDFKNFPVNKLTFKKLMILACKDILFSFNNKLYEQHDGMCMGSNLGPTMAGFAMHMVESQYNTRPLFYKRYVDDIFAIFDSPEDAENFHQYINTLHTNIKFTKEDQLNDKLIFLDVEIEKNGNRFNTRWHMKKTNTGTYLHKTAYSPDVYKKAAIKSLIYRAFRISSSNEIFESSYEVIKSIFICNGYHYKYIDRIKTKVIESLTGNNQPQQQEATDIKNFYFKLPFLTTTRKKNHSVFKQINEKLSPSVKINLAYQTRKTKTFFANKDKVEDDVKSQIVYKYSCDQCNGNTYVGETTRHFITRRKEHLTGERGETEVSSHVHLPKKENFTIVLRTKHTLIGEALIYKTIPAIKRMNNNSPPFQLQLFNFEAASNET